MNARPILLRLGLCLLLSGSLPLGAQTLISGVSHRVGERHYESSDHRSNIHAVVSDRKAPTGNTFAAAVVHFTDYYPYGMPVGSRSEKANYRFGFQGQEDDQESRGWGNTVHYTYRMHDTRIGRFFAVDPLIKRYPELSAYGFSGNRLVDAVELEGLEMFLVHGTRQGYLGNSDIFTPQTYQQLGKVYGNTKLSKGFSWKGLSHLFNNRVSERAKAAIKLAKYVVATRKAGIADGSVEENEPITLVGYSHGGNVSIQAAEYIEEMTGKKVNLITIATPAYNDGSTEDPAENSAVAHHLHLYSEGDGVDGMAIANPFLRSGSFGNETYENKKTTNIVIPQWAIPHTSYTDTHSAIGDKTRNQRLKYVLQIYLLLKQVAKNPNITFSDVLDYFEKQKDTKEDGDQ